MLTDIAAKQATAREKDYKISDAGGLLLFVAKSGHKTWRYKYRQGGKEKRLLLGTYPEVRLSEARSLRDQAKIALRDGRDPKLNQRKVRLLKGMLAEATFEKYARIWWEKQKPRWKPVHASDVITSMERDLFPELGALPLSEIDEPLLLEVLGKVEERGAIETARRLRQRAELVFAYAKATAAFKGTNPASEIKVAMKPLPKAKRWPAFRKLDDVRALIAKVDLSHSYPITRLASRFLALVAQRPGMVHTMKWEHLTGIHWDKSSEASVTALWSVPSAEMKVEFDKRGDEEWGHDIPLAPQAVAVLQVVRTLTGTGPYVFPNARDANAPMSESALSSLYRRLGFTNRHVPHGFRSSFSTIMNEHFERSLGGDERHMIDRLIIDLMLAHLPAGMSGDEFAYNRAKFMSRRREIACEWASLISDGAAEVAELTAGRSRPVP